MEGGSGLLRRAQPARLITKAASAADARALQHRRVSSSSFRPNVEIITSRSSLVVFKWDTHTHFNAEYSGRRENDDDDDDDD